MIFKVTILIFTNIYNLKNYKLDQTIGGMCLVIITLHINCEQVLSSKILCLQPKLLFPFH